MKYDTIKKLKELYEKAETFEKKWLGARGFFNVLHKTGAIDDEDHKAIMTEYDRVMAPITRVEEKVKTYVVDNALRILWEKGILKEEPSNAKQIEEKSTSPDPKLKIKSPGAKK